MKSNSRNAGLRALWWKLLGKVDSSNCPWTNRNWKRKWAESSGKRILRWISSEVPSLDNRAGCSLDLWIKTRQDVMLHYRWGLKKRLVENDCKSSTQSEKGNADLTWSKKGVMKGRKIKWIFGSQIAHCLGYMCKYCVCVKREPLWILQNKHVTV